MRVVISPHSERQEDWIDVFGNSPVEVRPCLNMFSATTKYEIVLRKITVQQRQKLIKVVAKRRRLPVDVIATRIEHEGCTIPAKDVVVIEEDPGVLF